MERGDFFLLHALAFAALHQSTRADKACKGFSGTVQQSVICAAHKVFIDGADFGVAVDMARNQQSHFVIAWVKLRRNFGIMQSCL